MKPGPACHALRSGAFMPKARLRFSAGAEPVGPRHKRSGLGGER